MSGRGRGISNAPAWMTRQNQNQLGSGSGSNGPPESLPPPPSHSHSHSHLPERDAFGRAPRGGGGGGGPYALPPRGGGGGGGGGGDHNQTHNHNHHPYDDRRRGPYDDRDRRRGPYDDPHHRRRGGPPDDWRRGGGGRREMHHRDRDGHRDRRGGGGNHNNSNNNNNHNNNNNNNSNNHNNPDESISSSSREQLAMVTFRSYDEEQDWAEERRRKRKARPSKFDVPPTPQQLAAEAVSPLASNPAATDFAGIPAGRDFSVVPQQTRHARRLYIGHLPPNVHEQELHDFFRNAIETASVDSGDNNNNNNGKRGNADPILSVYINHERRFCFLEFRDVAMTTACMALDGININGKGKVKVKRPNDYNPTMAPKVHPTGVPILDVSKLGIISSNVQDGPNKVFIGGLHYHLTEAQVLELLQAFGKVKAFHLVKNEPDAITSKGYCFVEFAEPGATPMAVLGLNGMDMGGGKVLTARVAGQRTATGVVTSVVASGAAAAATAAATATSHYGQSAGAGTGAANLALAASSAGGAAAVSGGGGGSGGGGDRLIVGGYDIEALVDAAMGLKPMPMAPTHLDTYGVPVTRMGGAASLLPPARAVPMQMGMGMQMQMPMQMGMGMQMGMQMQMPMSGIPPPPPPPPQIAAAALPPGLSALDIANAALDAAFGPGASTAAAAAPAPPPPPPPPPPAAAAAASGAVRKTRILVLLNMVENEDLESDEEYKGLMEEVEEEVKKFGKLLSMKIPRKQEGWIEASAIGKIFLEYATTQDAGNAEGELSGRQFGPNVVQASYHDEQEYAALKLR